MTADNRRRQLERFMAQEGDSVVVLSKPAVKALLAQWKHDGDPGYYDWHENEGHRTYRRCRRQLLALVKGEQHGL